MRKKTKKTQFLANKNLCIDKKFYFIFFFGQFECTQLDFIKKKFFNHFMQFNN
jgi:hypothetical protein